MDISLPSVKFGKYIAIKLIAVICDGPTRPDVRYIVNHNGETRCDRCFMVGRRLDGKRISPNGKCTLRTDDNLVDSTSRPLRCENA